LFKSGEKRNISNYRGISILSAISKLFEKLVCDEITSVTLISDEQHGFVGGRSTVTSLAEFCNFVLSEMDDELQVDAVNTFRRKISSSDDFLDGFLFDWSYTAHLSIVVCFSRTWTAYRVGVYVCVCTWTAYRVGVVRRSMT
jgi:hypothetical protein